MSAVEKEYWEDEIGSVLLQCVGRCLLHYGSERDSIPIVFLPACKNKNKLLYVATMGQHMNSSSDDNESNSLHEITKRQSEEIE